MTRSFATALAALTLLGAGCATTRDQQASAYPPPARSSHSIEQDYAYIARVEQQARVRGVHVQWINPPRARNVAAKPR